MQIYNIDISVINRQTYKDQYKYCRIDYIYDGDTADIFFLDNNKVIRHPFRFYGYDSEEIKQLKTDEDRDIKKQKALDDKNYLTKLVHNQYLVVKFTENEKYGRMMGWIWRVKDITWPEESLANHPELIDNNCINKEMILSGHGKIYNGGKKV